MVDDDSSESAAPLDPDQEKLAAQQQSLDALATHEVIRRGGQRELERPAWALAWSGTAAGFSMALSFIGQAVLRAALPDRPWARLVASLGYALGFLAVILGSQQLFTENTLTPIVPFMTKHDWATFRKVCKLWAVVLVTNLAGGVIVALALAHANILTDDVCHVLRVIGEEAMTPTRHDLFLRGIAAGWIIALMVWMLPAAQSSAPFIVFVMTWLVGAAQLPHVVVGAIEVFHLAASGGASWSSVLGHYVLPVLAGNIWGGITLVSAVNHGQVVAGRG